MSYFILDNLGSLFQRDILHIGILLLLSEIRKSPSWRRTGLLPDLLSSYTVCPASVTWVLTQLRQWKIRLRFSMLIAISPKQCNQGLMCTYNFILDISLTAIYCLKGKGGMHGKGEGTSVWPPLPKQTQQLYVWRQSLCKVQTNGNNHGVYICLVLSNQGRGLTEKHIQMRQFPNCPPLMSQLWAAIVTL